MEKIKRIISKSKFDGSKIKKELLKNNINEFVLIPIISEDKNKLGEVEGFDFIMDETKLKFYKKICKVNEYKSHPNVKNSIKHDLTIDKDYIVFDIGSVFKYEVIDDYGCLIMTEGKVFQ